MPSTTLGYIAYLRLDIFFFFFFYIAQMVSNVCKYRAEALRGKKIGVV